MEVTRRDLLKSSAGDGKRLAVPVFHDHADREYAYGPAQSLPDTTVGNFTPCFTERPNPRVGP